MPPDTYIPTSEALRLLGYAPRSTAPLRRLQIPHKRDFTHYLWSRNAIYAELKRRRLATHPPPGYITLSQVAARFERSLPYTLHILHKYKLYPSHVRLWSHGGFRRTSIYPIKAINKIIAEQSYAKTSFPPEGWLEIKDCTSYLSRTPENVRQLCRLHNVRIKKLRHSKYLYNEDDIVRLRKHLRSRKIKLNPPQPKN